MENLTAFRLASLLKAQGLTQKELAIKAGVTESAVSHYLKGDRIPRGAILLNLANSLGVSTDYLLNEDNPTSDSYEDIETSYRLLARNAKLLSIEQKTKFLTLLLQENK